MLNWLWCLNNARVHLKAPKRCQINIPKPLCQQQQPESLIQSRRDPCFRVFLNCWILTYHLIIATLLQENHQTRQRFCPVLVSLCELKLQLPILSWLEWHMVWSLGLQQQYAVILLLKTCAMVWGATFVLSGGFFELLLPSYQFILLWFLASTMHFHREKLVRIFSLWPFSVNFEDDCVGRWQ